MKRKRIAARWNWWPINRPRLWPCDPDGDDEIWVVLEWGNGNSDPVWAVEVLFSGWAARPFIAWAGWRWDRAVRRRELEAAR